jgi:spore maturation protein CgeB
MLPGIPTIRMFEALACGMPLVSCRWDDCEGLFTAGSDYLSVDSPAGMLEAMRALINDSDLRRQLAQSGCDTIRTHHTCAHRVDQLLNIAASIRSDVPKGMTA